MAEELPGPAEELRGQHDLPREREAEAGGEGAAGGPGAEEEERREGPGAAVDGEVGGAVGEGEREGRVERGGQGQEVEDEQAAEEDGAREQRVRGGVDRVPVLRTEEGELRLQVQHAARPPLGLLHGRRPGAQSKSRIFPGHQHQQ
uniref:Uncharacterized protein n=1 Tax=Triticum urartu TaxID=4572 RepID=A0A8R7R7Y7_TRIUA